MLILHLHHPDATVTVLTRDPTGWTLHGDPVAEDHPDVEEARRLVALLHLRNGVHHLDVSTGTGRPVAPVAPEQVELLPSRSAPAPALPDAPEPEPEPEPLDFAFEDVGRAPVVPDAPAQDAAPQGYTEPTPELRAEWRAEVHARLLAMNDAARAEKQTALAAELAGTPRAFHSREEWLEARRDDVIGASEVAVVLGVSRFATPWDLYALKRGIVPRDEGTARTQRGHDLEPVVLQKMGTRRDLVWPWRTKHVTVQAPDPYEWLRVSPDRFVRDPDGTLGCLEVKVVETPEGWGETGTEIPAWGDDTHALVPPDYALQAYAQMAATGLPWVDFAVLVFRAWEVRVLRVHRDEAVIADLLRAVGDWRERHLVQGIAPDLDGSSACTAWLGDKYAGLAPPRRATEAEERLIRRYKTLSERIERAAEERDLVRNQILLSAGEARALLLEDNPKGPRAQVIRSRGGETLSLRALRETDPALYQDLKARGHVHQGAPKVYPRIYGWREEA